MRISKTENMYKNLMKELLKDSELRTRLILNGINSEGEIKSLGYDLLLQYYKTVYKLGQDHLEI